MGLQHLFRDGQAKTGVRTEFLAGGTFRVEAIEDCFELTFRYARTLIGDRRAHGTAFTPQSHPDNAAWRAERDRVGDQVAEDLNQAAFDALHGGALMLAAVKLEDWAARRSRRAIDVHQCRKHLDQIDRLTLGAGQFSAP